jgi:hypothetical protein
MGEFCRDERFRLIAGVQETIFDNPRFTAAQDEVRRVRERFQSFRIAREDIAYVVQRRILGKNAEQKNRIREHLSQFAPAFESLGRDVESFVDMFPVHPAYLKTFEALTIVEKRRILSSLTEQIRQRLDPERPVPAPSPARRPKGSTGHGTSSRMTAAGSSRSGGATGRSASRTRSRRANDPRGRG